MSCTSFSYVLLRLTSTDSGSYSAPTVTPQGGLSREEALNRLAQSECLARQVYEEIVTAEMGKAAQAEALYAYLTEQVRYDFRYLQPAR